MIDFLDHRERFEAAIERATRLIGIDAERLERDRDAAGSGNVAGTLQAVDDLRALRVPRNVRLDDADKRDQIRLRAELLRDLDALLDFCQQRILSARLREAGGSARIAGADQAHALETSFLLRLDHRLALAGMAFQKLYALNPLAATARIRSARAIGGLPRPVLNMISMLIESV